MSIKMLKKNCHQVLGSQKSKLTPLQLVFQAAGAIRVKRQGKTMILNMFIHTREMQEMARVSQLEIAAWGYLGDHSSITFSILGSFQTPTPINYVVIILSSLSPGWSRLVQVGPGQVQVRSRLGPGQLHVNSKSFNIKVYFISLRDLDLELVAIIAMPPPPTTTQETFLSRITLKSLHV